MMSVLFKTGNQCMHHVSHQLSKIGQRVGVNVVFSAPNKLSKVCRLTCPIKKEKETNLPHQTLEPVRQQRGQKYVGANWLVS